MKRHPQQQGFAMVAAIVVLVILAMLGAFMVTMSNTQQISAVRDLQGSKAYYAARAGVEWGAYRALQNTPPLCTTGPLPNAVRATGFNVLVVCTESPGSPYDQGGVSTRVYQITATATLGTLGAHDYTERQVQAVLSRP